MAVMTRTQVFNDMLATLAERPVNSLEDGHPLTAAGLRALDLANSREQAKGWWFNKEITDLEPDLTGTIYLPGDVLQVDPVAGGLHYVQRGRRLYKPFERVSANKYKFDRAVTCWLTVEVPFEDLPMSAQAHVSYQAQLDFMKDYDADQNKVGQVTALAAAALITINSEHIRSQDVNVLNRVTVALGRRNSQGPLLRHIGH